MPSPSPSITPSSFALFSQQALANGSLGQLTRHGSAEAWPSEIALQIRKLASETIIPEVRPHSQPQQNVTNFDGPTFLFSQAPFHTLHGTTDTVNLEIYPHQSLQSYASNVDKILDADFQDQTSNANSVAGASNGDGDEFIQHLHCVGSPYEFFPLHPSPVTYGLRTAVPLEGMEYRRSKVANEILEGIFEHSLESIDHFTTGLLPNVAPAHGGEQTVPAKSAQPPFQPNVNITPFLFGSPIPMQQRTPCPWIGCSESFVRSTDVQRHLDAVHLGIRYHCFWVGCPNNHGKGYCRLEKLRTHQRQKHGFALM